MQKPIDPQWLKTISAHDGHLRRDEPRSFAGRQEKEGRDVDHEARAMAAFSISESLALALSEGGVLDRKEVIGLLQDAASAHYNAVCEGPERRRHQAAARLIEQVISGVRSVGQDQN